MVISLPKVSSLQFFKISLRVRWVIVQNKKSTPAAPNSALMMLTMSATFDGSLTNCEKRLAVSMKNGAPGGCPTSNLYPVEMNSGQSQKLAVGSTVRQ